MSVSILLPVSPSFHLCFVSPSISSYAATFRIMSAPCLFILSILYSYIDVSCSQIFIHLSLCSSTLWAHPPSSSFKQPGDNTSPEECAASVACRAAGSCSECIKLNGCGWSPVREKCFPAHPIAARKQGKQPQ
jgi:hypothetical protein